MAKADSLRLNKVAAGVLVAGLVIFGVRYLGDYLYEVSASPESVGYAIAGGASVSSAGAVATASVLAAISPLLASASVDNGEKVFKKCVACHTHAKGGAHRIGPNLYELVGSMVAGREGFVYSDALSAMGGVWDYERLNGFLHAPRKYVKGTKMGFAGLKKVGQRADIILYLRSLSDSPQALP